MADAQDNGAAHQVAITAAGERIRDCDTKMARYRAAIDAGGDITEITSWINATKADRAQAEAALRNVAPPRRMTAEDIRALVSRFAQLGAVIATADPAGKAEIYRQLNLILTYQPAAQTVAAIADLGEINHGVMGRVRGGDLNPSRGGTSPNGGSITSPT
jgi:site-specific DNA recombinase